MLLEYVIIFAGEKSGLGSILMERFCKEVDNCFTRAYLDGNVLFYRKFGFEVTSKSSIFNVENKYMVRAPQT